MPSASAKLENQASQEAVDPLKQVLISIEHKKRNLEKRKAKLESYREEEKNGKVLKGEQLAAVSKYDEVIQMLEFANEMAKLVQTSCTEQAKSLKKQQRKEQQERTQGELSRLREMLNIQDLMTNIGNDLVRADFLAGKDGAVKLTEDELNQLDELYNLITPKREDATAFSEQVSSAADHYYCLMEGRNKKVVGTTYASMKDILQRISKSGYFDKINTKLDIIQEPATEVSEEIHSVGKEVVDIIPTTAAVVAPQNASTPQLSEQRPPAQAPSETVSYFTAQVVQAAPQYPPNLPPQAIPPPNAIPVQQHHQPQQQARPISDVIGQAQGSINFLQESQLEIESTPQTGVDIAAMLQYQPSGVPPNTVLPPGRGPAAPAASAVPQPDFHQKIPTQTFTNQKFPPIQQNTQPVSTANQNISTNPSAPHIPSFPAQQQQQQQQRQPNVHNNFLPQVNAPQEVPTPMVIPPRAQEDQTKRMTSSAPASFAQAATLNSQAQTKPLNSSGAPPGFAPQKNSQSQFQPIPSLEQVAEQEESNTWNNDVNDDHEHGSRGGGYRRGRGRGRGGNSNGYSRPRGSGQQNGGRQGGYQNRGNQDSSDRGNENGYSQREYNTNYKRSGGPPRENSNNSGRGQGYRGSAGPYRGGPPSANRMRGGTPSQGSRPQNVKQ